ncbi:MarR family winged helix-turn-helix transcriptional regulator [Arthrobacter sp. N1]|uniref:MarR family winged helix-turn-helix transcriptional regulator n=1 Tax=Arthrobacter sp. N1 TaxID=619291 RepID=UPI003BB072D3
MNQTFSEQERRTWLILQAVTLNVPPRLSSPLFHAARITMFDYYVLAILSEAERTRMTLKELAGTLSCSLSRLGHVIRKLQKRGWITRSAVDADGQRDSRGNRGMAVLTDVGFDTVVSLAENHVRQVRAVVFDALDNQDVSDLERISTKILDQIRPPQ